MQTDSLNNNPFHSFWMAGYECADHINAFGNRVNLCDLTGHLDMIAEDYKNLSVLNIKTVREGIQWSKVEKKPYEYDWGEVGKMIIAAKQYNIQQVWDMCHFGFPDDLTPLHPMFARRFAALCRSFVVFFRNIDSTSILIITPINEVGFLSWLGGDVRGTSPFCTGQGWEVKYKLMQAYIEGIEAIKNTDASARILITEPLINVLPPINATNQEIENAAEVNEAQFQVTEILSGRICPELRGKPEYLDIIGYNYYYNNQWVLHTNEVIAWDGDDSRYIPLHQLLLYAYQRYQRPVVLSETSHFKNGRVKWLSYVCEEITLTTMAGLPLWGVCWYPILNRPDWDFPETWHQSGFWDDEFTTGNAQRTGHDQLINSFLNYQGILNDVECNAFSQAEM